MAAQAKAQCMACFTCWQAANQSQVQQYGRSANQACGQDPAHGPCALDPLCEQLSPVCPARPFSFIHGMFGRPVSACVPPKIMRQSPLAPPVMSSCQPLRVFWLTSPFNKRLPASLQWSRHLRQLLGVPIFDVAPSLFSSRLLQLEWLPHAVAPCKFSTSQA